MQKIKVTQNADSYSVYKYNDIVDKMKKETFMLFVSEMYNSGYLEVFEEVGASDYTLTFGLIGYCMSHDQFLEAGRLIRAIKTILPIDRQDEIKKLEYILTTKTN